MASKLTPIGWIAKFLVVPAAIGSLGYFLIGPRIGAVAPAPKLPIISSAGDKGQESASDPKGPKDGPPPGVEVSSKPAGPNLGQDSDSDSGSSPAPDDNPKPRVRSGHRPPSMVAPPTDPQPDEDGSGGGK